MSPSTPNGVRTIRTYHGQCTPANAQHWALPGARGTSVLQPLTTRHHRFHMFLVVPPSRARATMVIARSGLAKKRGRRGSKQARTLVAFAPAPSSQHPGTLGHHRSRRCSNSLPGEAVASIRGPFVTSLRSNLRCPVRTARDPRPGHYFRSMAGARRVRTTTIALRPVLRAEPRTTESLGIEIDPYGQEVRGYRCGRANAEPPGEIALAQVPLALTGVIVVEDVRRPPRHAPRRPVRTLTRNARISLDVADPVRAASALG